ncbi:MAG: response regulator [Bdellovibrionaceae bacterium]|nr:response regulator [Pseudobdellovibrionaceae bacterium]
MTLLRQLFTTIPRNPWIGFTVFAILGVLGNALSLPLFFGVDVVFGSIFTLIAIAWLGPRVGIAATLVAASYTFFLWNHFYAAIVLVAEGVFVALVLTRLRGNLALSSTLFWLILGIPLHAALYHYGLGMDSLGTQLATVKQATTGIFNSVIASLILSYAPYLTETRKSQVNRIPVYQHIFNIFVAIALVPAAILLVLDARNALKNIEESAMSRLETVGTGISQATEGWLRQQKNAVASVAWQIEMTGSMDPKRIQPILESVRAVWTDFYGAFVTDASGNTLAFDPLVNARGESTLGLNFSDRQYFQHLKEGGKGPYVSNVFLARGGVFEPVFNVAAPIYVKGEFKGIVAGSLNLVNVIQKLHVLLKDSVFQATLVDREGNVIVSDNPEYKSLEPYAPRNLRETEDMSERYYYRIPRPNEVAPMTRWNNSYLGMGIDLGAGSGWKLYVEQPMSPMRTVLYDRYIRNMAYLLGLAMVILFGSMLIAERISKPLAQLSNETTDLPDRLVRAEEINWPQSRILELNTVTENFQSMVREFKTRFLELETSRNQLKLAKEEAETANRMKSSFLANMSHEIRTPLGIMVGFTDLLIDERTDRGQRAEFALGLKRNASQLSLLIDDILDLSKVEAGHLSMEFSEFSLRQMMHDLIVDFSPKVQEKNLTIELQIADDVAERIVSDSVRLKQILVNLVGNAIKFTSSGRIDLSVRSSGEMIHIDVTDQGMGISAADQEKLFKPFSQADESLTRKFGGTGLGLALSKRLGILLGGDLRLLRSELGKGSTFRLQLPARAEPALVGERPRAQAERVIRHSLENVRILLVEDSPDNQMLISHMLERAGATVEIANDGEEGVRKAMSAEFDAVLMDLQMPVMDGLTAARILRVQGYEKPLIALTAHAMSEFRSKCLEAGFNDHVAKPIDFNDLIKALSQNGSLPETQI